MRKTLLTFIVVTATLDLEIALYGRSCPMVEKISLRRYYTHFICILGFSKTEKPMVIIINIWN